ncbi:ankyrin repeat domain-containing protein [Mitsuaria sp. GD03876]|uniref:ankyrin repeat domain-containing protein n=1 Tax=Mitsuaria sp. GD03876 TaxID=2975399 RepID=UPI00244C57AF|nr:ankyrin repeat domain-containing protein [Mitsuaria sp. GD03876]MDH0863545.1 ankyrin repeat domain-containing protein [Mitsuaria sp. GD03876]
MTLEEVLLRCSKTAAWDGELISDLSQRNFMNDTPLHTVSSWGELEPVAVLIDNGADLHAVGDHGSSVLINAVIGKNPDVIRLLIKHGADPRHKNDWGADALEYARNVSAPKAVLEALASSSSRKR